MNQLFIMVIIMAIITYLLRVLPISLIRREIKSPFWKAFLNYVPFAILGALTVPDIFYSTKNLYSAIAGTIVALLIAYWEKSLLTVAVCGIFTVLLWGFLF